MREVLNFINKYIHEHDIIKLHNCSNEKSVYQILNNKNKNVGFISLTKDNELESFIYTGKLNKYKQHMSKENMIKRTKEFLNDSNLILASVDIYANSAKINYEEKDINYNLRLPNTGVSFVLNLAGDILSFNKNTQYYKVITPQKIITEKEAKSRYLNQLEIDLKISKLSQHDHYKLMYSLNEKVNHIPASGNKVRVNTSNNELKSLEPYTPSSKNLFKILGLYGDYVRIGKRNKKNCKIELWSKYAKKSFKQLNFDLNTPQTDVVKYKIDKHTNKIIQVSNGEIYSNYVDEPLIYKEAYNRALDFLFSIYPKADEFFDVIDPIVDKKEKTYQAYEPNYMYYFNCVHDSIEVENQIAYIGLGKYTGKINQYRAPSVTEKNLAHINVFAKISEAEAKIIYERNLKMKLGFIKKYDQENNIIFELAYLPVLFENHSNKHYLDAHEGTVYEV